MIENIEDKDIKSFEYTEIGNSDGNITGICELGKCSFETFNKNNKYSSLKKVWVKTRFGEMYIYENNPDQANETIKFECYDARYKLDKEYNKDRYSFPMTLREYRNAIFDDSGMLYTDEDSFPNEDLVIENAPYVGENPTNRDVIKIILQAAMSTLIKDYNDIFSFSWFNDEVLFEATDCIDLTTDSVETDAINLMVLGRGSVEDNVYYPIEKQEKEYQFRIDNNYILDDQGENDKRYDVIQPLYERIKGFKYVIYDLRTTFIENKLDIKIGSKIKFYNRNEETVESYVMNKTITYLGSNPNLDENYEVSLSAEEILETNTEIKYASNIKNGLLRVERKTDKNSGEISDLVKKTTNTAENLTKVEQTIDEIKTTAESAKKSVKTLEEIMDMFSVDLETHTFSISTDNNKKPLETKDFAIKFFSYFKGQQVSATANTADTCEGIDISFTGEAIILSVSTDRKITNLNNEITVNFVYEDENKEIYTLSKKLIVSLSLQGEKGETGEQGPQGTQGIQGVPGVAGTNGTSTYFYVKFSANSDGNPMTDSPTQATEYMGVASTTSSSAPSSYTSYQWSKIKGEDGKDGTPGTPGANGLNTYLHIMYSADGSTFVPEELDTEGNVIYELGKKPSAWIGQYADNTEADSTNFDDYIWYKFTEDIDPKLEEMETDIAGAKTDINNNYQDLNNKINNCATTESVITVSQKVEQILTDNSLTLEIIKDIQFNGVSQVKTKKGYIFNDDGLLIKDSSSPVENLVNQNGIDITNIQNDTTVLFAGYVDENNTKYAAYKGQTLFGADHAVVNTISVGTYSRFGDYIDEDGNCGTGPFEI